MKTKTRIQAFSYVTEVEVTIDPDDLHDDGWHHESECGGGDDAAAASPTSRALPAPDPAGQAIASLHRQAHPSQAPDVTLCREEPCRSLGLHELRRLAL